MSIIGTAVSALPKGSTFARYALTLARHDTNDLTTAIAYAKAAYPDSGGIVARAIEHKFKSAVGAITTDSGTPLAQVNAMDEAIGAIRDASALDQIIPRAQRAPFATPLQPYTVVPLGDWRAEGRPYRVQKFSFDSTITLPPYSVGVIVTLSTAMVAKRGREMRDVEAYFGPRLAEALALQQDHLGFDPGNIGAGGVPAALTAAPAGTTITSTGTTSAAITADLRSMVNAIATPGAGLVWLMGRKTAANVHAALGAASDLPRTLLSIPAILTANLDGLIVLIDCAAVAIADGRDLDVERSVSADLQLDDDPSQYAAHAGTSPADVPNPSAMTSLFQSNLVALRVSRTLSWAALTDGVASVMSVSF